LILRAVSTRSVSLERRPNAINGHSQGKKLKPATESSTRKGKFLLLLETDQLSLHWANSTVFTKQRGKKGEDTKSIR